MVHILIIDDNPHDRVLAIRALEQCADLQLTEVLQAEDLAQALATGQFDLVVTDYQLRWTDGVSVLRIIKHQYPDCPVVMFTNSGSEEVAVEAMKAGLDDYIMKSPTQYNRLPIAVRAALERKENKKALRESETRYRFALEAAGMVAWDWNLLTDEVICSENVTQVMGLPAHATIACSQDILNLVLKSDRSYVIDALNRARAEKSEYRAEFRLLLPDGSIKWMFDQGRVTTNADGEAIRMHGVMTDITARKVAEEAQRQADKTLQTLFESSPLPIVVIEVDGRVRLWNPAAESVFGWHSDEVVGNYIPIVPEEKKEECRSIREAVARGETFVGMETYRCHRDGRVIEVLTSAAPLYSDAGVKSIVLLFNDVTERRRVEEALKVSQAKLQSFVDANVIGILFGDIHGGIHEANDEFLRIVGYTREDLHLQKIRWNTLTPKEHLPLDTQHLAEARERGACTPYEKEYIRKNGSRVPILVGYSLFGEAREESVAFIIDLTDRKASEAERDRLLQREQAARVEAERANHVKDEFLAVLSHELRTPLNPILGWVTLLKGGKLDAAKTSEAINIIERNARLQVDLIADLLDISRILRGKLSLNVAIVNLADTIASATETVRLAAQAKGIEIRVSMVEEGSFGGRGATGQGSRGEIFNQQSTINNQQFQVMGDAARLQQVIWNLLSNAVKFTPKDGRVEVELACVGSHAQITVRDTGKGISPDFLPYMFDYFRQEDASTTRKFGGLGLGLAIVKKLVELHGGLVEARSPGEGQGSTFVVKLPLIASHLEAHTDNKMQDTSLNLSGINVLVVDDDADSRELVDFTLQLYGAKVTTASSASQALKMLEESKSDVLVCDIGMPEMDGYELLQKIRTEYDGMGQIPAIALTAYAGEGDRTSALAAGFALHISKPVEPDAVVAAVAQVVNVKES